MHYYFFIYYFNNLFFLNGETNIRSHKLNLSLDPYYSDNFAYTFNCCGVLISFRRKSHGFWIIYYWSVSLLFNICFCSSSFRIKITSFDKLRRLRFKSILNNGFIMSWIYCVCFEEKYNCWKLSKIKSNNFYFMYFGLYLHFIFFV